MTDRIVLQNIRVPGRHGVSELERSAPQPFEIDVEVAVDLGPAGRSDDLTDTVDYRRIDAIVREVVGHASFHLLEALAETIAGQVLAAVATEEVTVRVRKPAVALGGPLDYAGVEIRRRRAGTAGA